jgi:hypothetical protein
VHSETQSKDLQKYIKQGTFPHAITLKHLTFLQSTNIPHSKLKDRLKKLVQLFFLKIMVNVDRNELILFCEKNTLVLSNNIQQTVGIRMSVNCAPLLAEMFLYYCKADFMQGALKMKLVLSFNFTFCYDYFL